MSIPELTDNQEMIRGTVRGLAEKHFRPKAAEVDRTRRAPLENIKLLAEHGFTGLFISEEYGGPGLGLVEIVIVVEELARCCANTALLAGTTEGAAPRAIFYLGNEAQRRSLVPKLTSGEFFCGWGMSEPNAGSDLGSMQCKAVRHGNDYVVNGTKMWCTAAQFAEIFVVFARLTDDPGLKGIGALLVPRDAPGFKIGKHIGLVGLHGTGMAELVFEDCRVTADNLLLPPGHLRTLLPVFNADRIATNPPICLGIAQAAFEAAVKHCKERVQFGQPIAKQQGIQWRLADMAIDLEAGRALLYRAAGRSQAGKAPAIDASIVKVFVNEMARRVTDQSLQLFGAYGLSEEFPMERMVRDVRGLSIGYGTTEIQRNTIAHEILEGRYVS
jgi:alkylation response protein AidB-like acyl-CoA dehydrogenase